MKKIAISLLALALGVLLAVPAMAGPGSVEVTVPGDITLRMGAQVRIAPTQEYDRDFGLADGLTGHQETAAAKAMPANFGSATDSHLTEAAGAVRDGYIRTEDRLFFNFAHAKDWDVYMMLETDSIFQSQMADTTDFILGSQTQQFGIERLEASFNLPWISSRLKGGWDVKGIDDKFGGLVYADDDPGIGLAGAANGWKWAAWYVKHTEDEAGYGDGTTNPIGSSSQKRDQDRTFYYGKLGSTIGSSYLEAFYMLDRNSTGNKEVTSQFAGLQGQGTYGIVMPMFEVAYNFGDWKYGEDDLDIGSWGLFADVALDLHEAVGIKKFEPHIGGYYMQGDDDPLDNDLEGFNSAVSIDRFTPRFGTDVAGISNDHNPILGQLLYSIAPNLYGSRIGGGIAGVSSYDNPGLVMLGGGLKAAWDKWTYITNLMAMWYDDSAPVEAWYAARGVGDVEIDEYMGLEWNNELRYNIYKAVTIKLGAGFLFPGDGAEDITQALDAYAREEADFADGNSSDDVSMKFAVEFVWFF